MNCPQCHYDLRGSITPQGATCPECGPRLTERDLARLQHQPNRNRNLASPSPHEASVSGWWIATTVIAAIVIVAIIIARLIASGMF
jgi:hypothetical protein